MNDKDSTSNVHAFDAGRSATPSGIPADQLERIIARASVFQNAQGEGEHRQLSEAEIVSIGEEVGLAPEHVRRALAEWRADSLAPPEPDDDLLATRLVGPAAVRVRRLIDGNAASVHRRFDRHLRDDEYMRPVRRREFESLWECNDGLACTIRRGLSQVLDTEGRSYELSELKSLSIVTAPAGTDQTMVTLTADLSEQRSEELGGWGWSLLAMAIVGLVFVFVSGSWWSWLLLFGALGGAIAAPFAMTRSFRATRRRTALLLEGLLDQLEFRR
ncbi:hypothetical protein IC757_14885 [Wenzhouxiangella sp. AB-CW3]|uniref:hypothetical protein n=1 Tax=Wenzhouxiangella sp. AB-CW3 TaxID=2771012 RepID=UPI00168A4304|nr:hypothetical protein [Wenzhouxiangella sp. AB-CW3]QOC22284.1 hypothetical protein IC757_14885 [Wenzhouxiangella sp. AB-CW3]